MRPFRINLGEACARQYFLTSKCPITGLVSKSESTTDSYIVSPHPFLYLNIENLDKLVDKMISAKHLDSIQAICISYLLHSNLLQHPTKLHKLSSEFCISKLDEIRNITRSVAASQYLQTSLPLFATSLSQSDYGNCENLGTYLDLVTEIIRDTKTDYLNDIESRKLNRNYSAKTRETIFESYSLQLAEELNEIDRIDISTSYLQSLDAKARVRNSFTGFKLPSALSTSLLTAMKVTNSELRNYYFLMLTKTVKSLRLSKEYDFSEIDFIDLHTDISNWESSLVIKSNILKFIEKKLESFQSTVIEKTSRSPKATTVSKSKKLTESDFTDLLMLLGEDALESVDEVELSDSQLLDLDENSIDKLCAASKPKSNLKSKSAKTNGEARLSDLFGTSVNTSLPNAEETKKKAKEALQKLLLNSKSKSVNINVNLNGVK